MDGQRGSHSYDTYKREMAFLLTLIKDQWDVHL